MKDFLVEIREKESTSTYAEIDLHVEAYQIQAEGIDEVVAEYEKMAKSLSVKSGKATYLVIDEITYKKVYSDGVKYLTDADV